MSTACIIDDVLLHCGARTAICTVWTPRPARSTGSTITKAAIWGSAYYVDGKIFLANEDGDLFIFKHDKNPESLDEVELASKAENEKAAKKIRAEVAKKVDQKYKLAKVEIGGAIRSTPVVANGVLYVMTENTLYAFKKKD